MKSSRMADALITARVPKKEFGLKWRMALYSRHHANSSFRKLKKDEDVEALKHEVRERCRYYFKGMGATVNTIMDDTDLCHITSDKTKAERVRQRALKHLDSIKKQYAGIPFEKLEGNADYYPLFAARNALEIFEKFTLEQLAEKNPEKMDASRVRFKKLAHLFTDWGYEYRDKINEIFERIHKIENNREFGVDMTDDNGRVWRDMPRI